MGGVQLFNPPDASRRQDQLQKFTDGAVFFDRMSKVNAGVDDVTVSSTVPNALQYSCLIEMVDQSQCAALGDPHSIRDFPQRDVRVVSDADEHVPVVAEKCPMTVCHNPVPA